MIEMKKCKECKKLFTPKNPRQQYCEGKHFRPCPVCGKDVEIKYLSDPTPRCAECRKLRIKKSDPVVRDTKVEDLTSSYELPSEFVPRRYVGKSGACKFIKNHIYLVKVKSNRPYGFYVDASEDITSNELTSGMKLPIASPSSFFYFFKEVQP